LNQVICLSRIAKNALSDSVDRPGVPPEELPNLTLAAISKTGQQCFITGLV
jgi:hypothetical protein